MRMRGKLVKLLWGLLVVCLLMMSEAAAGERNRKHEDGKMREKKNHVNYLVSKRRIPNGPDPIHNRRAGNSHQPPGQA
ncbi:hypothetical protein ACS0TY_009007 [Phlomoides rotata]